VVSNKCFCGGKSKDPENRSKKYCVCGGHNASNVSRNKNHHSTKNKLNHRKNIKFDIEMRIKLEEYLRNIDIQNNICDRMRWEESHNDLLRKDFWSLI